MTARLTKKQVVRVKAWRQPNEDGCPFIVAVQRDWLLGRGLFERSMMEIGEQLLRGK